MQPHRSPADPQLHQLLELAAKLIQGIHFAMFDRFAPDSAVDQVLDDYIRAYGSHAALRRDHQVAVFARQWFTEGHAPRVNSAPERVLEHPHRAVPRPRPTVAPQASPVGGQAMDELAGYHRRRVRGVFDQAGQVGHRVPARPRAVPQTTGAGGLPGLEPDLAAEFDDDDDAYRADDYNQGYYGGETYGYAYEGEDQLAEPQLPDAPLPRRTPRSAGGPGVRHNRFGRHQPPGY